MGMKFRDLEEYIKKWKFIWKENCPFCKIDWDEKDFLIFETKYWTVRYNKYPYFWNTKHLLSCPKKHKKFTYELTKAELGDIKEVELLIKTFYKWEEYFSFIREGIWWRSAEHLHYHFLPGIIFPETIDSNPYLRIKN